MARLGVCALLLVAASGSAAAQHARYPREQPLPPPPVFSERVRPHAPPPGQPAGTPVFDTEAVLSIEGLRTPVRAEVEQILVQLIQNTPDSEREEKADYYLRLGEHYAKQHRFWRMKSAEYTAQATAADRRGAALAASHAKASLLKAVKTFKALVANDAFREYPKLDVALFYYAYTLQSGKYMKEARAVYDQLLKTFPSSKYVPEAHLAFADYYVDAGQLADAEARYKQVVKYPRSSVYAYALYKLGSIHAQLSRFHDAALVYAQVLTTTRGDAKRADLHRAARAELVRAYARADTTEGAYEKFYKVDAAAALELVELLGDVARENGSHERAVRTYRELMSRAKGDARSCRWQHRITQTALAMPGVSNAKKLDEIDALVRIYASLKTPDDECRANVAAMSGELAAAHHAEWARTQNPETLGHAERLYAMHVTAFPDAEPARAQYAEVLWSRADRETDAKLRRTRWRQTAEVFGTLSSQEAARAAALAWMNALDVKLPASATVSLRKAPRSRLAPRRIPERAGKLIAAVAAYVGHEPQANAELAQMRLAVASVLRRHRHFDDAVTMLDEFLAHHQDHPSAELAANWLLDSLIQARRLDDVREVAAAIAADVPFITGKPALLRNLQLVRSR